MHKLFWILAKSPGSQEGLFFQIKEPEAQRGEWFMPSFPSLEAHWNHLGSLFRIQRFGFGRCEVGLWQEYVFKTSEAMPMHTFC